MHKPKIAVVTSFSEFHQAVQDVIGELDGSVDGTADMGASLRLYFRGQADAEWGVIPKIARPEFSHIDFQWMLRDWKEHVAKLTGVRFSGDLEAISVAQHFGIPTPLLDWTSNPLIAAYFASCEQDGKDGCVYCMHVEESQRGEFYLLHEAVESYAHSIPMGMQFYRIDLPNTRIARQSAVFSYNFPCDRCATSLHPGVISIIKIKSGYKAKMVNELDVYSINAATIYPDCESIAKYITPCLSG